MQARFDSERDQARDRVYPYKMACILLYAAHLTPGITQTSPGIFSIDYAEFKREMQLSSRMKVQMYLQILRDLGILEWVQIHKTFAIVCLAKPKVWET